MIRHDYTGCATCHADPSGGGLLTLYGRAQSDLLLRMRYGEAAAKSLTRLRLRLGPGHSAGVAQRGRELSRARPAGEDRKGKITPDFILMQADARRR